MKNWIHFHEARGNADNDVSNSIAPIDISPIGGKKIEQKFIGYKFPKQTDGRSFQSKWLQTFSWLEYSKERDAAFCFPCRQFSIANSNDIFCSIGYQKWEKALAKGQGLKKHETSSNHLSAMVAWKENVMRDTNNLRISSLINDTVLEKRQYYVKEIIATIMFLAENECPFRGDWDKLHHDESGLFQNMFKYMLKRDERLRKAQDAMPQNALYTSADIQNEIIHTIANCLRQRIVDEVNEASYLTLMCDGSKDKNGNEIFSIAFRYIKDGKAIETLLCFEKADDQTANGFFQLIVNKIEEHNIDHKKILSQCYDGASVMSGKNSGLQTLIQKHFNQVIPYVHCISHRLHLVVVGIVTNNEAVDVFLTK